MSLTYIDAEDYVILVRTDSHPAERHTVMREVSVGLDAASRDARDLRKKFPSHLVQIFHHPERGVMSLMDPITA